EAFARDVEELTGRLQAAGARIILATATVIGEEPESIGNRLLVPYNDAIRRIAREKGCVLADMHRAFLPVLGTARIAGSRPALTEDGVHMREAGDFLMAVAFLAAVGLPPESSVPLLAAPR
ncbi:MAG: hydrolase, partial [Planctomycetes bacterium]|nr:hydrolase [Planctomycetota bacterium]